MGADGLLLGTPPDTVPTEREHALKALAIDRTADPPVILYNYPGRMSVERGTRFRLAAPGPVSAGRRQAMHPV